MIGLCDRWHKTPDEIRAMSSSGLRLLSIYNRGHWEPEGGEE